MTRIEKIGWLLTVSAASVFGLACSSCSVSKAQDVEAGESEVPAAKPSVANEQITVGAVEQHDVGRTIVGSARVAFDEANVAHIFSPVTGRVVKILVNLGDKVKKGQPLAILSSPDTGSAESDVRKAQPAVVATKKELERQTALFAATAGTKRDLENAQSAFDQATAELQRATEKAKLLSAHAGGAFSLFTPIDGEVVARNINPGVEIQGQYTGGATQELFTVGKLTDVWMIADVYEQDIARVKLGAPVKFKLVAYPDKAFEGKVDWISGTLDPLTRTAKVRCVMNNPDYLLKPEMYATAEIETDGHKALAIARNSILHLGDKTVVMAPEGDKYVRRPVIVDEDETGEWVPISHGLAAGDKVVTSGALLLSGEVN